MLLDFRRHSVVCQLSTDGVAVVGVGKHKYIGTVLHHKLTFGDITDAVFKKMPKRLFLLRNLRNMDTNSELQQSLCRVLY